MLNDILTFDILQLYLFAKNYLKYLEIITNISTFAPDIIISTEARI